MRQWKDDGSRGDLTDKQWLKLKPPLLLFKVKTLAQTLPVPFIDSPTAALELTQQRVDFINNLDEIIFTGKVLPSGEAVWEVMYDDKIYYTRFA